jgi:protoheme IX farnesyltransferase
MPEPRHLLSLFKPRIVVLLCVTGLSGVLAAGGAAPATLGAFAVAGACLAGGAAACNCIYDRDLDREMERTAGRPLPSGRLSLRAAVAFAVGLLAVGTAVAVATLPLTAVAYMWLGVVAYAGVYTVVPKRWHPAGVVLGGSAGSFPVLAGWATTGLVELPAVLMAALVFAWTPAHAWALAQVYRDDFAEAGVPTLPAVASTARVQRGTWASALVAVAVAALLLPFAGRLYATAFAIGSPLLLAAYRSFHRSGSDPSAVRAFFTSNAFLAVLFAAWAADGVVATASPAAVVVTAALAVAAFASLWARQPALRGVPAAPVAWRIDLERRLRSVRARWSTNE